MNLAIPTREYDALIFDCDGTLTDSMPVHYVAWRQTLSKWGLSFPEDRFYSLGGMPTEKIIRLLASEQNATLDAKRIADEKELAFLELIHLLEPIPAVIEVVRLFQSRVPMVVASGGFRDVITRQLLQIGCDGMFDDLVTAEDTERHKPEPDVFLEAARRVQANPARCLVYEDSDLGLQAARAAGMDFIDIRTFHTPKRISIET
ncbi:MAG: HAD-IA family hydrolase [Planctomycetes bacterium]|nr:HAD-IA family hydrolase [Planctomycetota bacterium]